MVNRQNFTIILGCIGLFPQISMWWGGQVDTAGEVLCGRSYRFETWQKHYFFSHNSDKYRYLQEKIQKTTGDWNIPVNMWEKSGTHYYLAAKIPSILAEKMDRNVSGNSRREPAHCVYLPKSLRKFKSGNARDFKS